MTKQRTETERKDDTRPTLLFLLLVPHGRHDEVLVLEVVHGDRLHVREHLARVRQPDLGRADGAARVLDDAVAQRGHE